MSLLHLPDNIKVHFASMESKNHIQIIGEMGVQYALYSAYIPKEDGRILGISKIARVVGYCSARLQLQERLARDIVEMLTNALEGKVQGMAIVMRGTHMCKTMRGVKNNGQMTVSYLSGCFKEDAQTRQEFYKLIDQQKD